MKRIKNMYAQICAFDNLYTAYVHARKSKRYRREVLKFSANLEDNLIIIQEILTQKIYRVGSYREFFIYEPKKRLIMALPFIDRVVQWAVYQLLNPIFIKGYITDSYACIEGRGTHMAVKRLQYWLRQVDRKPGKYYYLKLDISKYFYRIDHQVLMDILRKKIKDPDLLWLLDIIVNSDTHNFGLLLGENPGEETVRLKDKGMPIGNLTSQMFANLYLNELDQYIKRHLSIPYYVRYMDDVIILDNDKKRLHQLKDTIDRFLQTRLKLDLNNKTAIRPVSLGIEFCGFRIWSTHIKLRKKTALKMKRNIKRLQRKYSQGELNFKQVNNSMQSYFGVMKHFNSQRFRNKILEGFALRRDELPEA